MKQDNQVIAEIYDLKRRYKENPEIVKAGEARKYQRKLLNIESNESDKLYNELEQIFNQIRKRNQQRTREQDLITSVEDIIQRYIKGHCELPDRKIRKLKKALYTYEPHRGAKLNKKKKKKTQKKNPKIKKTKIKKNIKIDPLIYLEN